MTTRTPNLDRIADHATWKHLAEWLRHAHDDADHGAVCAAIDAYLGDEPGAIDRGLTWAEMADRGGWSHDQADRYYVPPVLRA
jgi:hypothetical protein